MEYLKIQNAGELDIRLISLMGGSTKSGDKTKIGKFGTGLKYSLAWLVRNNIAFRIFVGTKEIIITTKKETIAGTDFNILYIDGERSSITSTMGVDWEGWMICREIYCNALDEGGLCKEITSDVFGKEGYTTFYIQNTGEIKDTTDKWDDYFIQNQEPIFENNRYALYPAKDTLCIYKNGVLIYREKELKSVFAYDFKNADINEMREYKGSLTVDIVYCLAQINKKAAEIFLSSLSEDYFEGEMDYQWGATFGEGWKEAIGGAKIIASEDFKALKDRGVEIHEEDYVQVPKGLYKKICDKFPTLSAVRRAEKVTAFYETVDKEAEKKINVALSILEGAGYEINPELKWIVGVFGSGNVLARINQDEKLIMFSTELKRMSNFEAITAIIEENEHFITGKQDCTREFQQHFINLYANQILKNANITLTK